MRLQTLSSEGHRCGTHSFFLFLLSGVSAFLSDLSASPSSVLWLSAFHSLSPCGLAQRTGGTGASDKLHSPHQPLVAEGPSSHLPFPAHLQYLPTHSSPPAFHQHCHPPESWLVRAPAGPRSQNGGSFRAGTTGDPCPQSPPCPAGVSKPSPRRDSPWRG